MRSENVTFWTLPRVLSQFSCEIWGMRACMYVWYSIYIYNACDIHSSKQVPITCRVWYLQLWWQENWLLLRTAHLVTTPILERLLQHAEGVLHFQQAHKNHTPVFSWRCVCVFSTCPAAVDKRKGERRFSAHSRLTRTPVICTQRSTHERRQSTWLMKTWLRTVQCGSPPCQLYQQEWEEKDGGRRTVSAWGNSVTLVSCS